MVIGDPLNKKGQGPGKERNKELEKYEIEEMTKGMHNNSFLVVN